MKVLVNKFEELRKIRDLRIRKNYEDYFLLEDFFTDDIDGGHLSPFTKSSHNVNSEIVFVLQDWASEDYIRKGLSNEVVELGYDPNIRTNINLIQLLKRHFNKNLDDIYTTNLFPFIKKGSMNTIIPSKFLKKAATDFLIPMVNIIKPRLVVCFGLGVFNAIRQSYGFNNVKNIEQGINSHFTHENNIFFCQAHPGMLGKNNRNKNGINRVEEDWKKMVETFVKEEVSD